MKSLVIKIYHDELESVARIRVNDSTSLSTTLHALAVYGLMLGKVSYIRQVKLCPLFDKL